MASPTGDDDTDTNFSFTSDHIEDQLTSVGAGGASSHPPNRACAACVAHCVVFAQHTERRVQNDDAHDLGGTQALAQRP